MYSLKILSNPSITTFSDWECPFLSTFVLSPSINKTFSEPTLAILWRSVFFPSTAVESNLKSPVSNTTPTGVCIARAQEPAIECATLMNSMVKQPHFTVWPSFTVFKFIVVLFSFKCLSTKPRVRAVPYTGTFLKISE